MTNNVGLQLLGSLGYGPGLLDWALRGAAGSQPLAPYAVDTSQARVTASSLSAAGLMSTVRPSGGGSTPNETPVGTIDPATLGKDDFLRLLLIQIQYQDPTNPLDDRAFLAQMAQFSALEQTTNVARNLAQLGQQLQEAQSRQFALSLLGKRVEVRASDGQAVQGTVEAVNWGQDGPEVVIAGKPYGVETVTRTLS
ncbi:MAG: hypothetical protein IMX01_02295 [Limnochordaceae bacterium]|nr:hypothetical protein [Limnochordaceae bacterium]